MWVRVLGAAAGGGFPQWNCGCPCCRAVREGSRPCRPRTQSSVALSADYRRWHLLNASPDIRFQIESFGPLHPRGLRDSPIESVLLTDAELDHTAGLLFLREAGEVRVRVTAAARRILLEGTGVLRTLGAYSRVEWHPVVAGEEEPLGDGLLCRAFEVPVEKEARFGGAEVVGYRITDGRTGGTLVYLPGVQELTDGLLSEIEGCGCLLFDGTCWRDDEMVRLGISGRSSREMGHLPIGGEDGSLRRLAVLDVPRRIYIHINNTNPVLLEDSPERRAVEEVGLEVAEDGMELEV